MNRLQNVVRNESVLHKDIQSLLRKFDNISSKLNSMRYLLEGGDINKKTFDNWTEQWLIMEKDIDNLYNEISSLINVETKEEAYEKVINNKVTR